MTTNNNQPVVWTISYLYPPNYSGAGMQAHREHVKFMKRCVPVVVLAARAGRGGTERFEEIPIHYFPTISASPQSSLARLRFLYKLKSYLRENFRMFLFAIQCAWILLRNGQPNDMVRFEGPNTFTFIPAIIGYWKGMHTILRMHMFGFDDPTSTRNRIKRGQFLEYLFLAAFDLSEVVVAISTAILESCRSAGIAENKLKLLHHGSNTDLYHPVDQAERARLCRELNLDPNKQYILFVGEAIERKGIDILIDAFVHLRSKVSNVELLLVGPYQFGGKRISCEEALAKTFGVERCRQKITQAQCDDFVHWVGRVENVQDYMRVSSVFCFPTRKEGLPLVVAEALASGLPIVISRLEGITTDLVTPQEGTIVSGFRADDYAEAMMTILTHPEQAMQMSQAARQRALAEFNLDGAVDKWLTLFQNLSHYESRKIV